MEEVRRLRERAEHWRVMARHITDAKAIAALEALAQRVEERIARIEAPPGLADDRAEAEHRGAHSADEFGRPTKNKG